jgi:hypothetical protein
MWGTRWGRRNRFRGCITARRWEGLAAANPSDVGRLSFFFLHGVSRYVRLGCVLSWAYLSARSISWYDQRVDVLEVGRIRNMFLLFK